jgi:hypothetical protein
MYKILAMHVLTCLESAVAFLRVIPNGAKQRVGPQSTKEMGHTLRKSDVCRVVQTQHRSNRHSVDL